MDSYAPLVESEHRSNAQGAVVAIALRGELDMAMAREVAHAVRDALVASPSEISLDLSGIEFIDCAGLSTLLGAQRAAERASCRLRITTISAPVHRLLALTETLDRLDVASP